MIDVMEDTGGKGIMLGQSTCGGGYQGHRSPSPLKGPHPDRNTTILHKEPFRRHPYALEEIQAAKNNHVNASINCRSNISVTPVTTKFAASGWA
ncbi:hypothetical protein ACNKHL_01655 [Shigella flexneri]